MHRVFINTYLCGIIKYLQENRENDPEKELINLGKDIGKRFAILYSFKTDDCLGSLLYSIVFNFLTNIYDTERRLEQVENNEDLILYLIYEQEPLFISINPSKNEFCASSVFAGIIESILNIYNPNLQVLAYNKPVDKYPNQVIYAIKYKSSC